MSTFSAIGIHNDLAAGQPRIAVRSADHELAGGIDMVLDVIVEQLCVLLIF